MKYCQKLDFKMQSKTGGGEISPVDGEVGHLVDHFIQVVHHACVEDDGVDVPRQVHVVLQYQARPAHTRVCLPPQT